MAQLRDAQTSELIAEGTPLEVALIAGELGRKDVLFDGVGEAFDADAVIAAHRENVEGLERGAREATGGDEKKQMRAAHRQAAGEFDVDRDVVANARRELEAARELADSASG